MNRQTSCSRHIHANGLNFNVEVFGDEHARLGIILLHGFPECSYSWRYQIPFLADLGYFVLAPDLRGYAFSDRPTEVTAYRQDVLVADVMGILDAFHLDKAVVVGHDWGAALAWQVARTQPARIPAVVALSVPYPGNGPRPPTVQMRHAFGNRFFYQLYFQQASIPERELETDIHGFLRRIYYALSGPGMRERFRAREPVTQFTDILQSPTGQPPSWMSESDLGVYVNRFQIGGFTGPLNWYRAMDLSWEWQRAHGEERIRPKALFLAGKDDPVVEFAGRALQRMPNLLDNLVDVILFDGIGHWVQMEAAQAVNDHLRRFLETL